MSFQAMAWAVKQKVGNATGKAILLMLANYADDAGRCFPSQETLATECECSKRCILDWLQKFEDMGILSRERRHGAGGYRRADVLTLSLSAAFSPENSSRENRSEPKCSTFTAEPIKEPITVPSQREPDEFDLFWQMYPNKVGKRAAEKSFIAARKRIEFAPLMNALTDYVHKSDDRAWCNPTTWLNQDRWEDRPAQRPPPANRSQSRPPTAAEILKSRREQGQFRDDDRTSGTPRIAALGHVP